MIVKEVNNSANSKLIIPEDSDDLFTLRRIIDNEDTVVVDTSRVVKQNKEFARPDKGERVKIRVLLRVTKVNFDGAVDRLRIGGTILNSDNPLVTKGVQHSVSIRIGEAVVLDKNRQWRTSEINLLTKSANISTFVLIAIDNQEAGIAMVIGTHVKIYPNIYSGQSGKRYANKKSNPDIFIFYKEILKMLDTIVSLGYQSLNIVVFGPGETKRKFLNYLSNKFDSVAKISIVEEIDVAGEDGIFVALRSKSLSEVMKNTKLGVVSSILDKIFDFIHRNELRFAIGINEIRTAADMGAIDSLIYSDTVFNVMEETELITFLNSIEYGGSKIYGVDATTDIGLRISSLGGAVALLRYQINLHRT